MMKIELPGVYDMPAEDYHADPCLEPSLSASIAKTMIFDTPWHVWTKHRASIRTTRATSRAASILAVRRTRSCSAIRSNLKSSRPTASRRRKPRPDIYLDKPPATQDWRNVVVTFADLEHLAGFLSGGHGIDGFLRTIERAAKAKVKP